MFVINVILDNVTTLSDIHITELLKDAGSDSCGSCFEVFTNRELGHVLIVFEKDVEATHEAYFDVIHELTDADLIDNVNTIERA